MSRSKKIFIFLFSVVFAVTANAEKQVAIGERGKVSIFDGNNLLGDAKQTLKFTSYDTKVAFSLDGKYLAVGLSPHTGGESAKIKIYENVKGTGWAEKEELGVGGVKKIRSLLFSTDKKYLIANFGGCNILLWDTKEWEDKKIEISQTREDIQKIDFSKGYLAAFLTRTPEEIHIYHCPKKTWEKFKDVFYDIGSKFKSLAFVPNTKKIAVLFEDKIGLIDVKELKDFDDDEDFDKKHKIIATKKETYSRFSKKSKKISKDDQSALDEFEFQSFAFSPDGKWMALGFHHQKEGAFEYSIEIGFSKGRKQLPFDRHFCDGLPNELVFSPDSKYLGAVMEEKKIINIYCKKGIFLTEWMFVTSFSDLESPSIAFSPKIKTVKKKGVEEITKI